MGKEYSAACKHKKNVLSENTGSAELKFLEEKEEKATRKTAWSDRIAAIRGFHLPFGGGD